MPKDAFEPFAIPVELRSLAEQSVTQARKALEGFMQAATQTVGQMHGQAEAVRSGTSEIAHKSMEYAEQNMTATFDFAHKLMQAKSAAEVMGLQAEYLGRQMRALSTQYQELGRCAAKMLMEPPKPKP